MRHLIVASILALCVAVPQFAQRGEPIVIPAGTEIVVRLIDSIDSTRTGMSERFRCSIDDPIVVGRIVAVPRNADCTLQVTKVEDGKEVGVKLYDITVDGKAFDAVSSYAVIQSSGSGKGKKAAKRGVGLGALGAGVGAIAGGGKGAAIGGATGAGLGALSGAASKGQTLLIPSETRLAFQLRAPLPL